jgi:hypothetical protein
MKSGTRKCVNDSGALCCASSLSIPEWRSEVAGVGDEIAIVCPKDFDLKGTILIIIVKDWNVFDSVIYMCQCIALTEE